MDYKEVLALADQKQTDLLAVRSRNGRPGGTSKGPDPAAIAAFKARKEREERLRAAQARHEREQLLALRAQNSKSAKKAKAMTQRTRENDFSRITVNEAEVKDSEKVEEKIRRAGIRGTVERTKARLAMDERLAAMTRRDRDRLIAKLEREEPVKVVTKKTSVSEVLAKAKESAAAAAAAVKKQQAEEAVAAAKRRSKAPPPALSYDQLLSMANANSSKKPMSLEEHIKAEMEQKKRERPMTAKEKEQAREEQYFKNRSKGARLPTEEEQRSRADAANRRQHSSPSPSPSPPPEEAAEEDIYVPYEPEKVTRRQVPTTEPSRYQPANHPRPAPAYQQARKPPPPPASSRAPPERYSPTNARLPARPSGAAVNGGPRAAAAPYRPSGGAASASRPSPPKPSSALYSANGSSARQPMNGPIGRQRPPPPPQSARPAAYSSSQRAPPTPPSSAKLDRGRMQQQQAQQRSRAPPPPPPPPPPARGRPAPSTSSSTAAAARYQPAPYRGSAAHQPQSSLPYRPAARPPPPPRYSPPPARPRTNLPPIGATYRRGMYNDYEPERYGEEDDEDEYYDDEEEDEMADFIDDGPEEAPEAYEPEYSSVIRDIFGYDKRKYRYIADDDEDDIEEASFAQCMKEESHSARVGLMEDLEDMRREEEEERAKAARKKARRR